MDLTDDLGRQWAEEYHIWVEQCDDRVIRNWRVGIF